MHIYRPFSFVLAGLLGAWLLFSCAIVPFLAPPLGFPDGYISPYDRQMLKIVPWLHAALAGWMGIFFALGWQGGRKNIRKPFFWAACLLLVIIAGYWGLDQHYYQTMDHGQGG